MPIPEIIKRKLEKDLTDTFKTIVVGRPPDYENSVIMTPFYIHRDQWNEDLTSKHDQTRPVVIIDYPIQDMPLQRFSGNRMAYRKVSYLDFKRSDEIPSGYFTIDANNSLEIDFEVNEPNISYLELHTGVPTDSTSRLKAILYDENDNLLAACNLFNSEIARDERTILKITYPFFDVTSNPVSLKLKLEEHPGSGSNPLGIKVYTNASAEALIRSYYYKTSETIGQINNSIMRIEIQSKNLEKNNLPNIGVYVNSKEIVSIIAHQIWGYIQKNWRGSFSGVNLFEIRQTSVSDAYEETKFFSRIVLDVILTHEQVILTNQPLLKGINISNLYKL